MTYSEIIEFYRTCRAPTQREMMKKDLGMGDLEFKYFEDFLDGKDDTWFLLS